MNIADYLPKGKENAVNGAYLCALLHIDARALRNIVEKARRDMVPICASMEGKDGGYYLAANKREMQGYCRSLESRENAFRETREACELTIPLLPDD